ncbi:MAG: hypothetical protein ACD_71C00061G0004 [uncultured bacterium (gcode 4)]|uniref:Uncharacterized protein n=1 Tax=uncultured bacterium (gcode 4) TaxID=1234023 RepID=K1Z635_9BACT|nr:MAG: hypothetical protein ACD_71C00061G0004 [uncultured bacterium (gcode 4)]
MLYFLEVIASLIFSFKIVILLANPEAISVEVSARTTAPFLVTGSASFSTFIQADGTSIENPSPANGVVARLESVVVPQEVSNNRPETTIDRLTNFFIKKKG